MVPAKRIRRRGHVDWFLRFALAALLVAAGVAVLPGSASAAPFQPGDVFVAEGGGVYEFAPSGQLVQTLPGTEKADVLCFDPSSGDLILPGVGLFDNSGNSLVSNWAGVTDGGRCAVDGSGDVYVSGPLTYDSVAQDWDWRITEYDLYGNPTGYVFIVTRSTENGPFAMRFAPDGCTLYYGSWEFPIGLFNVCTRTEESPVSENAMVDDLLVLPDDRLIYSSDIMVFGPGASYGIEADSFATRVFYLSLDPDGTSFWSCCWSASGSESPTVIQQWDVATAQLLTQFTVAPGATQAFPIAVYPGTSPPPASASPPTTPPAPPPTTPTTLTPTTPTTTPVIPGTPTGSSATGQPSPSQIKALLSAKLVPNGKTATIGALLFHGGYSFRWSVPSAGRLMILWYQVASGAQLSRKRIPIVVATVSRSFSRSGTVKLRIRLTPEGRHLLKSTRRMKLTAKGSFAPAGEPVTIVLKNFTLTR